jgi:hypothetical protein
MTDPWIPIRRRPTDDELEEEAIIAKQDIVEAEGSFNRFTSEESRDLLSRDDDD